jgi:predicted MFS family arabinose efflux permease
MMFTFLPEFSRGTGIELNTLARLLSIRDMTGLIAPLVGRRSDRSGTRGVMLTGGALAAIGMALFALGSLGVVIGLICYGLAHISYNIGMNAWVGHEVAYERRGRASGRIEMTWAGAALVGLPTMGLLIDRIGWRAAPTALAMLALPLTVLAAKRLAPPTAASTGPRVRPTMTMSAWAAVAAFSLLTVSAQMLVFSHGIWLEDTYDFDPSQVGFAIITVGIAELFASYGSSRFADRIGKRNSLAVGTLILAVGLIGLTVMDDPPLVIGLSLLVIAFLGFEFGVVSAIPLLAELDPRARAEVIGRAVGLSIVGRALGSILAAEVILRQGFQTVMAIGAIAAVATLLMTIILVVEPDPDGQAA